MQKLHKLRAFGVVWLLAILCSFSNADQNTNGFINNLVEDFIGGISDENYDAPADYGKNITDLEIVSTFASVYNSQVKICKLRKIFFRLMTLLTSTKPLIRMKIWPTTYLTPMKPPTGMKICHF